MTREISRRDSLRLGAATAGLGAMGGLAGCSSIPFVGGSSMGNYSQWAYKPDEFQSENESVSINATNYKQIHGNKKKLYPSTFNALDATYGQLGIDSENVSMDLSLPDGDVISGSFDAEAVKSELEAGFSPDDDRDERGSNENREYESDDEHNGYEIFIQTDVEESGDAYGVSGNTIVRGDRVPNSYNDSDAVSATDVVKGIIDTQSGDVDRYVDENEDFKKVVDTLNSGTFVSASTLAEEVGSDDGADENVKNGNFDGLVARGSSTGINGGTVKIQRVFVFGSEGDISEDDINTWIEANDTGSGTWEDVNNIKVNTNGNAAIVTGKMDTYDFGR